MVLSQSFSLPIHDIPKLGAAKQPKLASTFWMFMGPETTLEAARYPMSCIAEERSVPPASVVNFCAHVPQNVFPSAAPTFANLAPRILRPGQKLCGKLPILPQLCLAAFAFALYRGSL